jgi:clan AA aspartic protease (TIGR02281 family)
MPTDRPDSRLMYTRHGNELPVCTVSDMKTLRWIGVLIIGIGAGYTLALWQQHPAPPPPAAHNTPPVAPPATPAPHPAAGAVASAVVYVDLYDNRGATLRRTAGILMMPAHTLIVPASQLNDASNGILNDDEGRQFPLQDVIAADLTNGVAAIDTPMTAGPAFDPPGDDAQLYLGRELQVVTPDGEVPGWVDSAPLERDDGSIYYKVHTREPLHWRLAALVDPGTRHLLGMTVAATEKYDVYEAVDAAVITAVLDNPDATPRTLAEFSHDYAGQTTPGRLAHLQALADAGRWEALIEAGDGVPDVHRRHDKFRRLLDQAYHAAAAAALDRGDVQHASDLLDQASRRLGDDPARLQLRADAERRLGDPARAREALHAALDMDPSLAAVIRPKLRVLVRTSVEDNGHLSTREKIQLLQSESAGDPDDAGYHRMLGELYYRQGDYPDAVDQLSRAMTLDDTLQADLTPMLRNARQRLATPALTDVPLVSAGSNFLVPIQINGGTQVLQFMLDTGASYTALSAAAAERLGIQISPGAPRMTLDTANGVIKAPLITLDSLSVNGAVVSDIHVTVLDTVGGYDGLLGGSFLKHFDFDISQSEQRLMLKRR